MYLPDNNIYYLISKDVRKDIEVTLITVVASFANEWPKEGIDINETSRERIH